MSPKRLGIGVGTGYVGDRAAFHDRPCYSTLLRTIPDRCDTRASLVVGVEPASDSGDIFEIRDGTYASAEIADVDAVPFFLLRGFVPQAPDFRHAIQMLAVTFGRIRICEIEPLTGVAKALFGAACTGPTIGKEAIHVIARVNFIDDGGHLPAEVGGVHTGFVQPRRFRMGDGAALAIVFDPFGMRPIGFFIGVVAVEPSHYADVFGFGSLGKVSE